nr:putative 2-aminoethylphosphonate ABC transporter permease subunit [Niveibacterium umoris]
MRIIDRERWLAIALAALLLLALLLGVGAPLLSILGKATTDGAGRWVGAAQLVAVVSSPGFVGALANSFTASLITVAVVLPLAYAFAAALTRTAMPGKALSRALALIPLLAPSLLPGISLVYLFGNQGLFRSLLPAGSSIYGLWGIVIGEAFYTFPHALMILITALSLSDQSLHDAARALGAGPFKRWLAVTFPGVRYGLASAALVVFTLVITDFGVPKVIGGGYNVLSLEAYKQVIGQQNFPRGAVIGLLLLAPAVLTFFVDRTLQRRQRGGLGARARPLVPQRHLPTDLAGATVCMLISSLLVLMLGISIAAAFMTQWPYNLSPTLRNFDFENMDGGGWLAYRNSLLIALGTAAAGVVAVFGGAYLSEKRALPELLNGAIRMLAIVPMAVPGLVLGLGYIFFFNAPANPLHGLYGTLAIMVLCTVAHFYTTAHMTAVTALKQLDNDFEDVAASLRVPFWKTFARVTVPVCLPAILEIARYFFISAMTTVSALVFLYTPDTVIASVAVLNMDDAGDTAAAAAMASMIVGTSAAASLIFALLSAGVVRRNGAWRHR